MDPDSIRPSCRLYAAVLDYWLNDGLNPTQAKVAVYCLRRGYVVPHFLPFEEWITLVERLPISETWLRQALIELRRLKLLVRDSEGQHPGYALNPDWKSPLENAA